MKKPRIASLFILFFLGVSGCGSTPDTFSGDAVVSRIVDGDTVEVSPRVDGIEDVRLIGVDAPEEFGDSGAEPYSEEASAFAEENLAGKQVRLEFDEERVDDYGRLLAYVHLGGEMFNEALIREGYAQVATFPPNTRHLDRFEAAQSEARGAGRGIWSLPENESCALRDRGNGVGGGCWFSRSACQLKAIVSLPEFRERGPRWAEVPRNRCRIAFRTAFLAASFAESEAC